MSLRTILFALLGVSIMGIAAVALLGGAPPPVPAAVAAPPPPVEMANVIVTARAVQAGLLLKPEDLAARQMPAADVPPGAWRDVPAARGELHGAMVRRSLGLGEIVRSELVLRPGDHGFLAAVLQPGTRAVAVAVDAVSGAAGLIWPGDRVDLLLTQALDENDVGAARRVVGEAVLRGIRVIAVDRQFVQGAAPASVAEPLRDTARTVTLEVNAEQATRIAVAARLGRLSLALRAAGTSPLDGAEPSGPIWGMDVSGAFAGPAAAAAAAVATPPAISIRMFQGPSKMEEIRLR